MLHRRGVQVFERNPRPALVIRAHAQELVDFLGRAQVAPLAVAEDAPMDAVPRAAPLLGAVLGAVLVLIRIAPLSFATVAAAFPSVAAGLSLGVGPPHGAGQS